MPHSRPAVRPAGRRREPLSTYAVTGGSSPFPGRLGQHLSANYELGTAHDQAIALEKARRI
jgi:hypothetical protein